MVFTENDFYQFQAGLMDTITWESKRRAIGQICNRCNARDIYESRNGSFTPEFRQIIESHPDECLDDRENKMQSLY